MARSKSSDVEDADEVEMLERAARGEQAAQRALFRREYARVFATVSRMLGSNRDIDDLVQETFIAVFAALPRFRRESKLATWIDRIAVNVVLQYMRANRQAPVLLTVEPPSPTAGRLVEQADAREGLRRLYAALAEMTALSRLAFALYAIDGRSIREVATLMGSTQIAAKVRIWRARREMERRADLDPVLAEFLETHRRRER